MWKQQIALRNVLGDPWPSMSMVMCASCNKRARSAPPTPRHARSCGWHGSSGKPCSAPLSPCATARPPKPCPALSHARRVQEHGNAFRNDIDDRIALVATLNEVTRACSAVHMLMFLRVCWQ